MAEAITACSAPRHVIAKVRAKLEKPVSALKLSGKLTTIGEGSAELGFKDSEKMRATNSLEMALRAFLDTRKDRLKVIFTGSSEDRLR